MRVETLSDGRVLTIDDENMPCAVNDGNEYVRITTESVVVSFIKGALFGAVMVSFGVMFLYSQIKGAV